MKSLIKEIHNSLRREAVLSEEYKKILDEIVEIENDLLSKLDDKDKNSIIKLAELWGTIGIEENDDGFREGFILGFKLCSEINNSDAVS